MFGDERASAKEINTYVFGVASGTGLSGSRDNETGDARANVLSPVTPPPTRSLVVSYLLSLVLVGSLVTRMRSRDIFGRLRLRLRLRGSIPAPAPAPSKTVRRLRLRLRLRAKCTGSGGSGSGSGSDDRVLT